MRKFNEYTYHGEQYVKPEEVLGKKINVAELKDDELRLEFEDGTKVKVLDSGQNGCEHRYMSTDDDLAFLVGKSLTGITIKETNPNHSADDGHYEQHDTEFLEFMTVDGPVTLVTHNLHNGYYGGFSLEIHKL